MKLVTVASLLASPLILLAMFPAASVAEPLLPKFVWDTIPVFYHSCNYSGPFTSDAIQTIAKFPLVVIEKGMAMRQPGYAEDKISATCKSIKGINPNASCVFYYNSEMDWPFYELHDKFLNHPDWWLREWPSGKVVRVTGDSSFPNNTNMLSFDFAQQAMVDFYISECINMTLTGNVDGCFIDQAQAACRNKNATCAAGHTQMFLDLQAKIGTGLVISNNRIIPGVSGTMMEGWTAGTGGIQALQSVAAQGILVQVHHYAHGKDGCSDPAMFETQLAGFLIGAGHYAYFGCSQNWAVQHDPIETAWHAEYAKPLGNPVGPGVEDPATHLWTRTFASGTHVTFDDQTKTGKIYWPGQPHPPPPPPPPPSPPAPPVPSGCGVVHVNTGQASNRDLAVKKVSSAADCCDFCKTTKGCVVWAWHSKPGTGVNKAPLCHAHDGAAVAVPNVDGCFSGHLVNTTTAK